MIDNVACDIDWLKNKINDITVILGRLEDRISDIEYAKKRKLDDDIFYFMSLPEEDQKELLRLMQEEVKKFDAWKEEKAKKKTVSIYGKDRPYLIYSDLYDENNKRRMAQVQLTCGHWLGVDEEPIMLSVKDYSRMGENVSSYGSYCSDCALEYEREGLILHNEKEIKEWFNLKED